MDGEGGARSLQRQRDSLAVISLTPQTNFTDRSTALCHFILNMSYILPTQLKKTASDAVGLQLGFPDDEHYWAANS